MVSEEEAPTIRADVKGSVAVEEKRRIFYRIKFTIHDSYLGRPVGVSEYRRDPYRTLHHPEIRLVKQQSR